MRISSKTLGTDKSITLPTCSGLVIMLNMGYPEAPNLTKHQDKTSIGYGERRHKSWRVKGMTGVLRRLLQEKGGHMRYTPGNLDGREALLRGERSMINA